MKRLIFSILIIIILILSSYISWIFFAPQQINDYEFNISKGSSAHRIANKLIADKIIRNKYAFLSYIYFYDLGNSLKSGDYILDGKLNVIDIIQKLEKGEVRLKKLKIIEGKILSETLQEIEKAGFGDYEKLHDLCFNQDFIWKTTKLKIGSLEGFLYPDTYHFSKGLSEEEVLTYLVQTHFAKTDSLDFAQTNLSYYNAIILASIVEKEVRIREEAPKVASVYLNRLKIGQKLQADPTVAYALLTKKNKRRKKIYYKDLKIDSPYNTYLHEGLPPAPICSPHISSIQAVLHPEETNYLYFFADGSGGHTFSETYSQHLKRQRK